jgi:hypothetical protein
MRNIRLFNTVPEFQAVYGNEQSGYTEPWVSYTRQGQVMSFNFMAEPARLGSDGGMKLGAGEALVATYVGEVPFEPEGLARDAFKAVANDPQPYSNTMYKWSVNNGESYVYTFVRNPYPGDRLYDEEGYSIPCSVTEILESGGSPESDFNVPSTPIIDMPE